MQSFSGAYFAVPFCALNDGESASGGTGMYTCRQKQASELEFETDVCFDLTDTSACHALVILVHVISTFLDCDLDVVGGRTRLELRLGLDHILYART